MAIASLCLVACSEDSIDDLASVTPEEVGTTLTAITPSGDLGTKVTFTDNGDSGISLDWQVDDLFSVYSEYGVYVCDFKCTNVSEDNVGTFATTDGQTLDNGNYKAIFPASTETTYSAALAADLTSTQYGDEISKLNDACMMTASFSYSSDEELSVFFSHEKAAMTLVYKSDIKADKLVFENGNDSYVVNYLSTPTADDDGYITSYIMIEPCEEYTRDLIFTFYNDDNIVANYTVESSKAYLSGRRYTSPIYDLTANITYNAEDKVYEISSANGLLAFENLVNNGSTSIDCKLMNDIDLSSVCGLDLGSNWEPIGMKADNMYSGTFDGNGYIVENIYIYYEDVKSKQGLFGYLGEDGVIKNLGITGSIYCGINDVTADTEGSGSAWEMGAIVSYNCGTVSNCYNKATVSGDYNVGGIVGHNAASALIENCYNRGDISGCRNIGGICGQNEGDVEYCYSTGEMTGYYTGQSGLTSPASARVGGVVGYLYSTTSGATMTTIGSYCLTNTTYSVGTGSVDTSSKVNMFATLTLATCTSLNTDNAYQDDSATEPINDGCPVLNWEVATEAN